MRIMANEKNLKPFVKGDPRINTTGLNKGHKWSLKHRLREMLGELKDGKPAYDLLIMRMLKKAIESGSDKQIELIWHYMEGKPKEEIDMNVRDKVAETLSKEQIEKLNKIIKLVKRK